MKMSNEQLTLPCLSGWLCTPLGTHPECRFTPTLHCPTPTVKDQTACLATPHLPPKPSQTLVDVLWQGTNRPDQWIFCSPPTSTLSDRPPPQHKRRQKRPVGVPITPPPTTTIALPRDCSERLPFVGWTSLFWFFLFYFFLSGLNLSQMEKKKLLKTISRGGAVNFSLFRLWGVMVGFVRHLLSLFGSLRTLGICRF